MSKAAANFANMSMLKQAKVVPDWGPAACVASISDELTWKHSLLMLG